MRGALHTAIKRDNYPLFLHDLGDIDAELKHRNVTYIIALLQLILKAGSLPSHFMLRLSLWVILIVKCKVNAICHGLLI